MPKSRPTSPPKNPFCDDARGLDFYLAKAARQLGYSDQEFWIKWLPKVAHEQDCVRHGLLALSEVYEEYMYTDSRPGALKRYNLAIRESLKPNGLPLSTALITCLLFTATEMIRGQPASAIQLLGHARAMLRTLQKSSNKTSDSKEVFDAVRSLFIDIEYNCWAFCRPLLCEFDVSYSESYDIKLRDPSRVHPFSTLHAAVKSLHKLHQEWMGEFWCGCENINHLAFYSELQSWKSYFEPLRACKYEKTEERKILAELEVSWRQIETAMRRFVTLIGQEHRLYKWAFIDEDEDSREESRDQMLDFAEEAIRNSSTETAPTFGLGSGLMLQMYMVAINCRQPRIRRRAVDIIRLGKRQEGLLKNEVLARVAERTIALEEEDAVKLGCLTEVKQSSDIPSAARIRHRHMGFSPDSSTIEWFYTRGGLPCSEVVA